MADDPSTLRSLPLFGGIDETELDQIAESAELRTARAGDVLAGGGTRR